MALNRFNRIIRFNNRFFKAVGGGIRCLYITTILHKLICWYYHCDIAMNLNVKGCYFNHRGFGIVINPNTKLGNNINIQHAVTIGTKTGSNIAPVVEDNVTIGAKATIIGPITIGHDSIVGAGAVVVKDVPPYSVVIGNPAKIIKTIYH